MYAALNATGQLVYAHQVPFAQETYYCCLCGQAVSYVRRRKGAPYFRHRHRGNNGCQKVDRDHSIGVELGGESRCHRLAKKILTLNFQQFNYPTWMEYAFESSLQVADLLVIDQNRRWVVEFQKSIISPTSLKKRHASYIDMGLQVIWLLDKDQVLSNWGTHWPATCLSYTREGGFQLWAMDPFQEQVYYYSQLPLLFIAGRSRLTYQILDFKQDWFKAFESGIVKGAFHQALVPGKARKRNREALIQSIKQNPTYLKYLHRLYGLGYRLEEFPAWLWDYPWKLISIKEPTWYVMALAFYHWQHCHETDQSLRDTQPVNWPAFVKAMNRLITCHELTIQEMPLLEDGGIQLQLTWRLLYELFGHFESGQ